MPGYAKQIIDFSLNIIKKILQDRDEINYTISTTSMYLALAMIQAGAKGKSRSELEKLLGVDFSTLLSPSSHNSELFIGMRDIYEELNSSAELATGIFTAIDLKKNYVKLLDELLDMTGQYISFDPSSEATETINRWVEERTHGRITDFLKESNISRETVLVLVNTIYFKELWKLGFSEKLTKDGDFKLESDKTVTVPFMKRKSRARFYAAKDDRFKAVIMEFQQGNYVGVFVLPKEHTTLKELISSFKMSDLTKIIDQSLVRDVSITIPKFKIDRKTKAKKILKALGVISIFDKNKSDLGNISELPLWVDDVIHRSTVKISEKGVSAATVTADDGSVVTDSSEKVFHASRPFIFIIMDQESAIPLFITAVYDPSKS